MEFKKFALLFVSILVFVNTYCQKTSHFNRVDSANYYYYKYWELALYHPYGIDTVKKEIYFLNRAIKFDNRDSFWYQMSNVFYHLGDNKAAESSSLKGLKLKLKSTYGFYNLDRYMSMLMVESKWKRRLTIERKGNNDTVYFHGSKIEFFQREFSIQNDLGIQDSNSVHIKALKNNLNTNEDYVELGWLYFGNGNYAKSNRILLQGIKLYPDYWHLYFVKAKIEKIQGKYRKSYNDFSKAEELAHNNETHMFLESIQRILIISQFKKQISNSTKSQ